MKPRILVFSSGTETGGGSGFEKLVLASRRPGSLRADISAVVCNHQSGGVYNRATNLQVPFKLLQKPWTPEKYRQLMEETGSQFAALSGWLLPVRGLDPRTTFNIHPGCTKRFGGKGMHGEHVHQAVLEAFERGEIIHTAVTMHFVTDFDAPKLGGYDNGPIFFRVRVPLVKGDTAKIIGERVNKAEHAWQWLITDAVVNGTVSWDGISPESLIPHQILEEDTGKG